MYTLFDVNRCSKLLAKVHYRKFAKSRYIANPPIAFSVATLPCKVLIAIWAGCSTCRLELTSRLTLELSRSALHHATIHELTT